MDEHGYPEDDELQKIREWPYTDCNGLLAYARSLWSYPDYWQAVGIVHKVSTGGWSGNESIISAMQENRMFWVLCWFKSQRGGHFEFELPRPEFEKLRAEYEATLNK